VIINKFILSICLTIFFLPACSQQKNIQHSFSETSGISQNALKNIATIDRLDVEHHWPAGVHVDWETGNPDGGKVSAEGKHTHCSAYAAEAAKTLGIYLLRPPEHSQILLANAQQEWLLQEGKSQGWQQLADGLSAQTHANKGYFVLATYMNSNSEKPGHIAIVRPAEKAAELISREGPQITQAGLVNYQNTSLANGFAGHPQALAKNEILYFAHKVPGN
jgi:hypothetical protein